MRKECEVLVADATGEDMAIIERVLAEIHSRCRALLLQTLEATRDHVHARVGDLGHQWSQPNLILLGPRLRDGDGLTLLREIKADPRTRPIPVVVVAGEADESLMETAYLLGANSFIQRPADSMEFSKLCTAVIRYWLRLNTPFGSLDYH
jgi:CheY-like chemotaxis protein